MPRRSPRLKARTKCTITERLRPFAALFRGPRRDEEKIAQVWRREIFGIPTRWDRWLDRELARGLELDAAAPRPGNVKCVLTVTFEEGAVADDGIFQEIDVYRLNIKVVGNADDLSPSPTAVYKRFEGSKEALTAPPWVRWPLGREHIIWQHRGRVASRFITLAFLRDSLATPGLSVAMVEWAQRASRGTGSENAIRKRAVRYGFPSHPPRLAHSTR